MNTKKSFWKRLYDALGHFVEICGLVTAGAMFVLLAYQIILRIFTGKGDSIANEIVTYSFIWLIYIGMVVAAKNKDHIMVTMLVDTLQEKQKCIVQIASRLMWLYFNLYVVWASFTFLPKVQSLGSVSPVMGVPMYLLYGILPITCGLTAVYVIRDISEFILVMQGKMKYADTQKIDPLLEKGGIES